MTTKITVYGPYKHEEYGRELFFYYRGTSRGRWTRQFPPYNHAGVGHMRPPLQEHGLMEWAKLLLEEGATPHPSDKVDRDQPTVTYQYGPEWRTVPTRYTDATEFPDRDY